MHLTQLNIVTRMSKTTWWTSLFGRPIRGRNQQYYYGTLGSFPVAAIPYLWYSIISEIVFSIAHSTREWQWFYYVSVKQIKKYTKVLILCLTLPLIHKDTLQGHQNNLYMFICTKWHKNPTNRMHRIRQFYHTEHLHWHEKRMWPNNTPPPPKRVELNTLFWCY